MELSQKIIDLIHDHGHEVDDVKPILEAFAKSNKKQQLNPVEGNFERISEPRLSDLFRLFEDKNLFTLSMDRYLPVETIERVITLHRDGGAYRKVINTNSVINELSQRVEFAFIEGYNTGKADAQVIDTPRNAADVFKLSNACESLTKAKGGEQ